MHGATWGTAPYGLEYLGWAKHIFESRLGERSLQVPPERLYDSDDFGCLATYTGVYFGISVYADLD